MSELNITKGFEDGDILYEADIDTIRTDVETKVNTTKIDTDNVADQGIKAIKIIDGTITNGVLASATFEDSDIPDDNVTTAKLNDGGMVGAAIADGALTAAKIAATTIVNDNIANDAIGTAEIAANAITEAMRNVNSEQSSNISVFTFPTSPADLVSKEITTTGGPVLVIVDAPDQSSAGNLSVLATTADKATVNYRVKRDSTIIFDARYRVDMSGGSSCTLNLPGGGIFFIDEPAAGTYTYTLAIANNTGTNKGSGDITRLELLEI